MKKMNFAILGTGNIAAQMADTVSRMNNVVLMLVHPEHKKNQKISQIDSAF